MKHLFVILFVLCSWICSPMLYAQLYTTSSASDCSYTTEEWNGGSSNFQFRSTSMSVRQNNVKAYSTAPIHIANGSIHTVASGLQAGKLSDEQDVYASMTKMRDRRNTMAPPTDTDPYLPLAFDWDVVVLFLLCSVIYAFFIYRKRKSTNA